jgi:hypothetical protein
MERANYFAVSGVPWAKSDVVNGVTWSSTQLRDEANIIFSDINEAGNIIS